ncbi:AzlC family protein [uncultured spirochete]|jgi:4-azaleucine resistance transporter AzlC|uniref:AzlC family protein n=1 Tax=uncultured spirochete TaxID=156406 RepID=A0A3P3XKK1_9SPIR|nr:AzlC family ABC transporter permease [Rectinema subterraneum]SLM14792.1 AzlC family protein [uncultured spirochete]
MESSRSGKRRVVLAAAFKASIPVLLGYTTLGLAFGFTLVAAGLPWWMSPVMAIFIYAGAAQFMGIGLITGGAGLFEIALLTLLLNGRHAVYGLSMLEQFKSAGKWKPYLIFGLTDETYGLLTTVKPPAHVEQARFYAAVTALNQSYWVLGCTVGSLLGSALAFDARGMDFALTALFIVLLVEQVRAVQRFEPYVAAFAACILALFIAAPRDFLLVALLFATGLLSLLRPRLDGRKPAPASTQGPQGGGEAQ